MSLWGFKTTADEVKKIDLRDLKRMGFLCGMTRRNIQWSCRGEPTGNVDALVDVLDYSQRHYMELDYRTRSHSDEEWKPMKYIVPMVSSPCRFGGKKWWFLCPNDRCRKRIRILYQYGDYFVCRKCAGLWYESQKYKPFYLRPLDKCFKADDLAEKLKRWHYRGRPTKKYQRVLDMRARYDNPDQWAMTIASLEKPLKKR